MVMVTVMVMILMMVIVIANKNNKNIIRKDIIIMIFEFFEYWDFDHQFYWKIVNFSPKKIPDESFSLNSISGSHYFGAIVFSFVFCFCCCCWLSIKKGENEFLEEKRKGQ